VATEGATGATGENGSDGKDGDDASETALWIGFAVACAAFLLGGYAFTKTMNGSNSGSDHYENMGA